jgi:hypothetical protein
MCVQLKLINSYSDAFLVQSQLDNEELVSSSPTSEGVIDMAGMLRVPRSRGAFSGMVLILLGLWGGLVPLVGPYAHYAYSLDRAWAWSSGRFWLEIVPAIATLIGGVIVLLSRLRPLALFGALLAALGGAWFAVGPTLGSLWSATRSAGTPVGGPVARAMEQLGYFTGLGVVIVLIASVAIGRLAMISVRDMKSAAKQARPAPAATGASTGSHAATDSAEPDRRGWRLVGRTSKETADR